MPRRDDDELDLEGDPELDDDSEKVPSDDDLAEEDEDLAEDIDDLGDDEPM